MGGRGVALDYQPVAVLGQARGTHRCRLDDRGRVRLPAQIVTRHAEQDGHRYVLKPGDDRCLNLYPLSYWEATANRYAEVDELDEDATFLRRMFFQGVTEATLDKNNRLHFGGEAALLAEEVGIDRDIVVLGVGAHYEIWGADAYDEHVVRQRDRAKALRRERAAAKRVGA